MDFTNSDSRESLINWADSLSAEIADRTSDEVKEGIRNSIKNLRSNRFVVAVLGKAKRGKSTLLNALLERRDDLVAPVDKLPASSAVSRFRWAPEETACVLYRDGHRQPIAFSDIREFVTEESNPENRKEVDVVEVEGPFSGLNRDMELVDTPGAASIHEHHDAILHAFIPQADAVIFLVTARMPLDQDELTLLREVKAADIRKIFFAINRVDEASEDDLVDAITHNRELLARIGVPVNEIHRISAKRAFNGDSAISGVPELMSAVGSFIDTSKSTILNERFVSRVSTLVQPTVMSLELEVANGNKTTTELQEDLTRLRSKKRNLESEREFAEREFLLAWERAVEDFEQGLLTARTDVDAQLANKISETTMLGVTALSRELPTWLTRLVENSLDETSRRCEGAMRNACERLRSSYPTLALNQHGSVVVQAKSGPEVVTGAVGGLLTTAMGAGFAVAGQAAAATIASANLAAVTTVAAPSVLSSTLPLFGLEFLAPLATGTATIPAATVATPLWVALSGPVGWTLAGVGVLAVPFSWRLSKNRQKNKLESASREQVEQIFSRLRSVRVPALRNIGKQVVEDFRLRLDRQLEETERAISDALEERSKHKSKEKHDFLAEKLRRIRSLLGEHIAGCPNDPR